MKNPIYPPMGNALVSDVVAGKTFSSRGRFVQQTGDIADKRGLEVKADSVQPGDGKLRTFLYDASTMVINGSSALVTDAPTLIPSNIRKDVTIFGVMGDFEGEPPAPLTLTFLSQTWTTADLVLVTNTPYGVFYSATVPYISSPNNIIGVSMFPLATNGGGDRVQSSITGSNFLRLQASSFKVGNNFVTPISTIAAPSGPSVTCQMRNVKIVDGTLTFDYLYGTDGGATVSVTDTSNMKVSITTYYYRTDF